MTRSTSPPRSSDAFAEVLAALREGSVELPPSDNELVGHVASLDALLAVAPKTILRDLQKVRDTFARARDAGGLETLLAFRGLENPELAAMEGRITQYVARMCGVQYGPVDYRSDSAKGATICSAWKRAGSPLTNNRFPYLLDTAGANYFMTMLWCVPYLPAPPGFIKVPRGGSLEIRGEYPYARYFAICPNDAETNNLETLVDVDLDPDPGSANPWREPIEPGIGRRYTARLVVAARPTTPAHNTSYVGVRRRGGLNPAVFLLYRIYAADMGSLPPNSAGVALPAVTVLDASGRVRAHHPECDPYPPGHEPPVGHTAFPAFPVPDHRGVHRPGALDTKSNWGLPVDLLSNPDVLYVGTCFSRAQGEVFVCRFKSLRTPSRRTATPLWSDAVDARMWSACTYNFWNGACLGSVLDEDAAVDADGFHTLVVSTPADRPSGATPAHGVTWLSQGELWDGQLTFRMLRARDDLLVRMKAAIDSGQVSSDIAPYVPRTGFCSRAAFESSGWRAALLRDDPLVAR